MKNHQRGGFVLGIIVGVLVGLVAALGVALYIAKVPVPFINKVPQRTAEQDQAETDRNRNWDPNAPLAGKGGVRPPTTAPTAPAVATATTAPSAPAGVALVPPTPPPRAPRDPGAILAGQSVPGGAAEAAVPIPKSTAAASNALFYFVQAGAYVREEDAEAQRARLALMDVRAKVTEREQSGRTMFRVRIGPFENKEGAEVLRDKLLAGGVDAALVHVQR